MDTESALERAITMERAITASYEIAKMLIEDPRFDAEIADGDGTEEGGVWPPIASAVASEREDLAILFCKDGRFDIHAVGQTDGRSPMFVAVEENYVGLVRCLLVAAEERGDTQYLDHIKDPVPPIPDRSSPYFMAVETEKQEIVALFKEFSDRALSGSKATR